MKTIFKILISCFIAINLLSATLTFLPVRPGYGKICAKELESPTTFARKHTETRIGYIALTGYLYSAYLGVYIVIFFMKQNQPN
jgi:hypothetical protein